MWVVTLTWAVALSWVWPKVGDWERPEAVLPATFGQRNERGLHTILCLFYWNEFFGGYIISHEVFFLIFFGIYAPGEKQYPNPNSSPNLNRSPTLY